MQATWNSKNRKIVIHGQHKPRCPRLWTVTVRVGNSIAKETMTFRPSQKMTLVDLEPMIGQHIDEFEEKHGEVIEASWIANAR